MNTETRRVIIAGAFLVGLNIAVGVLIESLLLGFSAIAFAILFHAIASATE